MSLEATRAATASLGGNRVHECGVSLVPLHRLVLAGSGSGIIDLLLIHGSGKDAPSGSVDWRPGTLFRCGFQVSGLP
jgi:hypothetical protein